MDFQELEGLLQQPVDEKTAIQELFRVVRSQHAMLEEINTSFYRTTYAAPPKPRTGMIRVADGTVWNPGAGAGLYRYTGATWTKL